MSLAYTYPGIYVQELSSSSHAVQPAPTSIAAFVGYSHPFQTEAFNVAQTLNSFNDYETYFGPLFSSGLVDASLPRAVYQFFLNGGSTAYVVGLQPGLFDSTGGVLDRLGAANGGLTITATTSGGPSALADFDILAVTTPPQIASISPSSVTAAAPSFLLTVNGSGFQPGAKVNWAGAPLATTVVSASQVTATIAATRVATAGAFAITVVNPAPGIASAAVSFAVNASNPSPAITLLSPTEAPAGGAAFTLTISGQGFVSGTTVATGFAGTAPAVTFVSDTELTLAVTAANIATAGPVSITATNSGGGSSAPATFTVSAANPIPTLSGLAPASITAGAGGFTLTVNGQDFLPTATVNWNGTALTTTFVTASQLTAVVPASNIAAAIPIVITVANPSPGGTSGGVNFTINGSNLVPQISTLQPASAPAGGAAFVLTVSGSNFVPTSVVMWNGAALPTTYVSDSQLTANVPVADVATVGVGYVTVDSPTGAGIVFTAKELTDAIPMQVTITNVRGGGSTFDVIITYGTRLESYRGVQIGGAQGQAPDQVINPVSQLVSVAASAAGYGTSISAQTFQLSFDFPPTLSTCFSASDYLTGDEVTTGSFEPNSPLDNLEIFNLLLTPGVTDFSVVSAALAFAERKRAFYIADAPLQAPAFGSSTAAPQPIQYWMAGLNSPTGPSLPESSNGAVYYPYLVSQDPVTSQNIPMAPSGFVAGIYAQTDASRGVWKAPAGLATTILNTIGPVPAGVMNDPQQGVLNQDSINCLRAFSGEGTVVWGARTLVAANPAYQQSMYVPVRRMTLFIEQSLVASLRWVVFEPNDEPLWIAITSSISAFMLSLFRQGALQGAQPSDAFQVKCDSTTTTSSDQALGVVNIVVAFAPLRPAEFVVIKIAQLAGQTAGS
jgi:phage tail sheath protein FI